MFSLGHIDMEHYTMTEQIVGDMEHYTITEQVVGHMDMEHYTMTERVEHGLNI